LSNFPTLECSSGTHEIERALHHWGLSGILPVPVFGENFDGRVLGNLHVVLLYQLYEVLLANSW
jgi:hypothetical protein